jgi:hypothetical protein
MFYFASFVRGLTVDEAIKQLSFIQKKGAGIVKEVLEEAREMAIKEHNFEFGTNMWVAESFTNQVFVLAATDNEICIVETNNHLVLAVSRLNYFLLDT